MRKCGYYLICRNGRKARTFKTHLGNHTMIQQQLYIWKTLKYLPSELTTSSIQIANQKTHGNQPTFIETAVMTKLNAFCKQYADNMRILKEYTAIQQTVHSMSDIHHTNQSPFTPNEIPNFDDEYKRIKAAIIESHGPLPLNYLTDTDDSDDAVVEIRASRARRRGIDEVEDADPNPVPSHDCE